jgi:hypothetical protein
MHVYQIFNKLVNKHVYNNIHKYNIIKLMDYIKNM